MTEGDIFNATISRVTVSALLIIRYVSSISIGETELQEMNEGLFVEVGAHLQVEQGGQACRVRILISFAIIRSVLAVLRGLTNNGGRWNISMIPSVTIKISTITLM